MEKDGRPQLFVAARKGELLGKVLLEREAITKTALAAALQAQKDGSSKRRLGEILLERGEVTEKDLTAAVAAQYSRPVIALDRTTPTAAALAVLDADTARELRVLPIRLNERGLIFAAADVPDEATLSRLATIAGVDIGFGLAIPSRLETAISRAYGGTSGGKGRALLGELLLEREWVSTSDLQQALHLQTDSGKRLGEVLIELGVLDERNLAGALSEQLGIPLVDLRRQRPDTAALETVPETLARSLTAVPMKADATTVDVVVADPDQVGLIEELANATGRQVRLLLAPVSEVRRAHRPVLPRPRGRRSPRPGLRAAHAPRARRRAVLQRAVDGDAPVVQVVNLIITQALRDRASDIHIEPQGDRMRIRMRIDGALHEVLSLPSEMGPAIVSRIKVMADMNIVERRTAQDGQIEMQVDGRAIDIRVATSPVIFGEKVALRLLDKSRSLYKLGDLGMSTDDQQGVLRSGAFAVRHDDLRRAHRKRQDDHALRHAFGDRHRRAQHHDDRGPGRVRAALGQPDPDQRELADVTLRRRSEVDPAPGPRRHPRRRDPRRRDRADRGAVGAHRALRALVAARDRRRVGGPPPARHGHRALPHRTVGPRGRRPAPRASDLPRVQGAATRRTRDELAFYEQIGGPAKDEFFHGEGCNFCSGTGYQERIGVYEVLRMTDAMRELVDRRAVAQRPCGSSPSPKGMRPLRAEALRLVAEDVTTVSEILRSVYPL